MIFLPAARIGSCREIKVKKSFHSALAHVPFPPTRFFEFQCRLFLACDAMASNYIGFYLTVIHQWHSLHQSSVMRPAILNLFLFGK
jgi:hypothetical protein